MKRCCYICHVLPVKNVLIWKCVYSARRRTLLWVSHSLYIFNASHPWGVFSCRIWLARSWSFLGILLLVEVLGYFTENLYWWHLVGLCCKDFFFFCFDTSLLNMGSVFHLQNGLLSNKKDLTTFNYLCQCFILECDFWWYMVKPVLFYLTRVILTQGRCLLALMLKTWRMST